MGKYDIPIQKALQAMLGKYGEVVPAPPVTKRTLEIGSLHSADFACVPFKYTIGNLIEALDEGANMLFQTASGNCRARFYGEVQEQILKDLGYTFDFYVFDGTKRDPKEVFGIFKKINPELTFYKAISAFFLFVIIVYAMDGIENYVRKSIGFEAKSGGLEKIEKLFHAEVVKTTNVFQVWAVYNRYLRKLKAVPLNKPKHTLKVGIVGEVYVVVEPFSNYFIEKELSKYGIEVKRYITLSYRSYSTQRMLKRLLGQAEGYINYDLGADATDGVAKCVVMAKKGYNGIIHLKPFGCMPEVSSIPMVQKISEDYKIPVLFFSFDSQTSETGAKTRIEAFYDMIMMKKRGKAA
jgi:predicted nucleotide-binding protein (sugar kinase/HSP70/actin superfamily)